jgi:hypothetical protein
MIPSFSAEAMRHRRGKKRSNKTSKVITKSKETSLAQVISTIEDGLFDGNKKEAQKKAKN